MKVIKNIILTDRHTKPIATDIHFDERGGKRPAIIYAHGFNGFKDWGGFDLIAKQFVEAGFTFIKFNFSFNGTTPERPEEFTDLTLIVRIITPKSWAILRRLLTGLRSRSAGLHHL